MLTANCNGHGPKNRLVHRCMPNYIMRTKDTVRAIYYLCNLWLLSIMPNQCDAGLFQTALRDNIYRGWERPAHNRAKDKRYFSYSIVKVCQIDGIKISWNQNFRIVKFMFSKKATKIVDLTLCSKCQIDGEDFIIICGLLRKHELYEQ